MLTGFTQASGLVSMLFRLFPNKTVCWHSKCYTALQQMIHSNMRNITSPSFLTPSIHHCNGCKPKPVAETFC